LLIDTPGMREVQLWEGRLEDAFSDIHALADGCRFRDCRHEQEPRCAVRLAADEGRLEQERLESFRKLQRELEWQARRQNELAMIEDKRKLRAIHKAARHLKPRG
jgi:ribosome biogenesis GTPase